MPVVARGCAFNDQAVEKQYADVASYLLLEKDLSITHAAESANLGVYRKTYRCLITIRWYSQESATAMVQPWHVW